MDFDIYQELAAKTSALAHLDIRRDQVGDRKVSVQRILTAALGLCGEAGEFSEPIKKWYTHGHALDTAVLAKELGDLMWYVAEAASALGLSLNDIAEANIRKLRERYPDGFSSERSRNRSE